MESNVCPVDDSCSVTSNPQPNDSKASCKKKLIPRKVLKQQLQESESINNNLQNILMLRDVEIGELKRNLASVKEMINSSQQEDFGQGSTIATSKLSELSRRIRKLTAELERYKSKYEEDHAKLLKIEAEPERDRLSRKDTKELSKKVSSSNSISVLNEQLQASKQRNFELLNQNIELKNNLKLARKCIQQEIGEQVNLNLLAQSNSSWRGRAQQIIALQNKVAELKDKIEANGSSEFSKLQLREIESKKKAELEELQAKVVDQQLVIEEQKNKIGALKIRNKNLTDDAMNYKLKTLNLLEQNGQNDNTLAVITEKMHIQKYQHDHRIKEMNAKIEEVLQELENEKLEHNRTKTEIQNLNQILSEKQNNIAELKETIKQQEDEMKKACGDFLYSCRDFKKEEFEAMLHFLENEKQGLINHSHDLKQRLDAEHEKYLNICEQSSKQKIKISRLEAKIRDLQKEQNMQHEKRKRAQRIAEYANNLTSRLSSIHIENSNSYAELIRESEVGEASENYEMNNLKDK